ncbi:sushi, von Willebrand factor type A, EGF and pentraxin domain-containing protein 1-like isoform X2 [Mercenaria mercenaria]|uniref:sushi, von Willebrand factor type A, EGF and pentraxin domain-containing protein 1-like isoform X2 n=1 Tax=Mercenaria mercenaria TaxID=6596 RepID=UPI00234F1018|nr:sushi, von Willebrand factor type A, EGF and pentraxin domain-containing protein 1-like isoform X2 [Mercenaria mercenaria]
MGTCVKADCDSPPSIANAVNNITGTPPYPEDTTVRYDCKLGYNPTGTSRFYTCNGNTWTDGKFRCEQIFCSHVKPPENGYVVNTPTNEVGTSIKFACNVGHDISGDDMMTCRTDGKWSPSAPPTCTPKDCGEFESLQYADTFQDNTEIERNHYGSVTEVTCQNGRVLNGPPRIRCESDGQWGDQPTCELLKCPQYPNTNASCVKNAVKSGEFYFLICKEDISTKTGPEAAECISGAWDSLEMACFCDCTVPDYNKNLIRIDNLNEHGNLPHNATLQWTCLSGPSDSSTGYVICTDGKLVIMKDENEVTYTNVSDVSDINHKILSELCYIPTTVTSTSTEVTSSQPTSKATPINSVTNTEVTSSQPTSKATPTNSVINTTTVSTDFNNRKTTAKVNAAAVAVANVLSIFIVCILSFV